jgi:hypothetical protein
MNDGEGNGPWIAAVVPHAPALPEFADIWPGRRLPHDDSMVVITLFAYHADYALAHRFLARPTIVEAGVAFTVSLSVFEQSGGLSVRVVDPIAERDWIVADDETLPVTEPQGDPDSAELEAAIDRMVLFGLPSLKTVLEHAEIGDGDAS